jgi:hypothetical protein
VTSVTELRSLIVKVGYSVSKSTRLENCKVIEYAFELYERLFASFVSEYELGVMKVFRGAALARAAVSVTHLSVLSSHMSVR